MNANLAAFLGAITLYGGEIGQAAAQSALPPIEATTSEAVTSASPKAPLDSAPAGTNVAPAGTNVAPAGTNVAPAGTNAAPNEGKANLNTVDDATQTIPLGVVRSTMGVVGNTSEAAGQAKLAYEQRMAQQEREILSKIPAFIVAHLGMDTRLTLSLATGSSSSVGRYSHNKLLNLSDQTVQLAPEIALGYRWPYVGLYIDQAFGWGYLSYTKRSTQNYYGWPDTHEPGTERSVQERVMNNLKGDSLASIRGFISLSDNVIFVPSFDIGATYLLGEYCHVGPTFRSQVGLDVNLNDRFYAIASLGYSVWFANLMYKNTELGAIHSFVMQLGIGF